MATNTAINQGDSTRINTGVASWGGAGSYFDAGSGTSGTLKLTNATEAGGGAGVGVITSQNANPPTFGGYIKIYVGTTAVYVPYFTNLAA